MTTVYKLNTVLESCGIQCGRMSKYKMVEMLKNDVEENAKVGRSPKPSFRVFCILASFDIKYHMILILFDHRG